METAADLDPHAESVRTLAAAMLRTGVWFAAVAVALSLVVATVLAGGPGAAGAAVGVTLGLLSSLATIGLMRLAAPLPVHALFGVVLGTYTLKILLLVVVATPLRGVSQLDSTALALSMLAVVVAWAAAEVVAFRRTPIPTIIPARD